MISKQHIHFDDDGTIGIHNVGDASHAIEETRRMNETDSWKGPDGYILGNIPAEYFQFDPWLIEAKKARKAGDYGKYTDYMLRFFRVHSAFACQVRRVNWGGFSVPLLDGKEAPKRPKEMDALLGVTP